MTVQAYLLPQSLDEAVRLLADDASMLVMAGGTITMPLINMPCVLNLFVLN